MRFLPHLPALLLAWILHALPARSADTATATKTPGAAMMQAFLDTESRHLDARFLEGVTNRASWEARRSTVREQYLEALGLWPLPERTPLKAEVTGVLQRSEGFRVENLHFQSRPNLYVTGNLYLPANAKAGDRLPAVLYVCGHAGHGRDGNKFSFQHHGIWFATHGYACLVIDTLQLGEIAAIHHGTYRYDRWWWQARGYTPAAVECWNGIRALDYLQSRPEVDPDRLAVTGISGGGAATFWIAAADERVKVAVPVSGMSDLEDYVANKVVDGHCDCMFCLNTFQWPWTQIAALVAPRPMLFANSGHDTIFPMDGNDRIRARLERLYGFYTNRTDGLFDIGVTPGGHEDKPELRLMAYRWINRHLKGDNSPVTEPDLPKFEGPQLRAFPAEIPADEINTKIDETFVAAASGGLPKGAAEFVPWRASKLASLRRLVFASVPAPSPARGRIDLRARKPSSGTLPTELGTEIPWKFFPATRNGAEPPCLVVLGEEESFDDRPEWIRSVAGEGAVLLVATRGTGPLKWSDPHPFYIRRALPLLGRTVDACRLVDVLAAVSEASPSKGRGQSRLRIAGRGSAGIIAAYAALFDERITDIAVVDPPFSHRDGPIFLNVLRVLDIPEALGLLAPRPLAIRARQPFAATKELYSAAGAAGSLTSMP